MWMIPTLGNIVSKPVPYHCSLITTFTDDLTEQPNAHDDSGYPAQDEQGNEDLASEGHDQATAEQQIGDPSSPPRAVDNFDEGESSNDAEPEQAQPADDEEATVGPLSGDEYTEQPIGAVEDDHGQGAAAVTDSENGYPGPVEGLDVTAVHEHSGDRFSPPLGENPTEYEEAVTVNEGYELDDNEIDQGNEHEETVAMEGDARDADWTTAAPDAQDLEWHKDQDDVEETDKREQVSRVVSTGNLTSLPTDSETIDLTASNADDDRITGQQGK